MTTPAPSPVAAEIAKIKERHALMDEPTGNAMLAIERRRASADDVPPLAAAIEAVLPFLAELAGGHDIAWWQREYERDRNSADLNEAVLTSNGLRAAELLAAVEAALSGTQGGEGQ